MSDESVINKNSKNRSVGLYSVFFELKPVLNTLSYLIMNNNCSITVLVFTIIIVIYTQNVIPIWDQGISAFTCNLSDRKLIKPVTL